MEPPAVGQVLYHQHPSPFRHVTLYLGVAAVALGSLADIDHRQAETLCKKGCKRNARGLATRNAIEFFEAGVAHDRGGCEIHDGGADAGIRDELAAIDVDGAHHA
jgi:hypothetical protein